MNTDRCLIWLALTAACIFAYLTFAPDADAQEQPQISCFPFNELSAELEKHKEVQISGGIVNDRAVVIIFGTPDGSTWTAVAVGIDGKACVIANGSDWFQSDLQKGQPV